MHIDLDPKDIEAIALKLAEILEPRFRAMLDQTGKDEILDNKALSEYIKMSERWIYNHYKDLPRVSPTGKPLYRKADIDDWLKNKTKAKHSAPKRPGAGFKQQAA